MKTPDMPFKNRELSWLQFNGRVLEEAFRPENPVLERLKFLSITGSNLDEFFMVRIAVLKETIRSGLRTPDESGLSPHELLDILREDIRAFIGKQYDCYNRHILPDLKEAGIDILAYEDVNYEQKAFIDAYWDEVIFPVLTPLAVDPSRPFPFLANNRLNIAVSLEDDGHYKFGIVQVPSILSRLVEVPGGERKVFLLLEDIIVEHLPALFELHRIGHHCMFRVTRNADLDIDEEARDLLEEIQKSIKKRKRGRPVRLELSPGCDADLKDFLVDMLNVGKKDIFQVDGPIDLSKFMKLAGFPRYEHLRLSPITPVPAADFFGEEDLFAAIREKDRFVHHPYEDFECVTRFVREAAEDPGVLAIKQTLYRVSGKSPIIEALIRAAENGKQVTVLVELKARFDEENNVNWAIKLEQAGCHVIYGLQGLKTHCKILLVVRREDSGIRRYLHMGTGNYNDSTARLYTDMGMFTCRESYGVDASALFNHLTGYSRPPEYNRFVVAPEGIRPFFCRMVDAEIENAKQGLESGITIKANSLLDAEIIRKLYEASEAGVPVRLLIRGICGLIPGVEGFSANIQVTSIVGQLLEHTRIFVFHVGGNRKIYIGSADLMPRNLDRRVELVFPIEDEDIKERLLHELSVMLNDNVGARAAHPDGSYTLVERGENPPLNSQRELYRYAKERLKLKKNAGESPLKPKL